MITQEEHNKIVQEVIETILNRMPEVIGNLMTQHAEGNKIKKEFYDANPEFKNHGLVVASVVEELEGKDLTTDYKTILKNAVPEIKKRLALVDSLSFDTIKSHDEIDRSCDFDSSHGVL